MSNFNKQIVAKTKQILKEMGYNVKVSHVYELLSKLSGEKNWNIASAKNTDFGKTLKTIESELNELKKETALKQNLLKDLKKKKLKDLFYLGRKDDGSLNLVEPFKDSHTLFVGGMGAGKTESIQTLLTAWLGHNSENTTIHIAELKGSNEYDFFTKYEQVAPIIKNEGELRTHIGLLYREAKARVELFTDEGVMHLEDYEQKTNISLNRCIFVIDAAERIEEFLNFSSESQKEGSFAHMLNFLMRTGRTYGIYIIISAQRATATDIPSRIRACCSNKLVFKCSMDESVYILGNTNAAEIESHEKGRCATEQEFLQFERLSQEDKEKYLNKVIKKRTSTFADDIFKTLWNVGFTVRKNYQNLKKSF